MLVFEAGQRAGLGKMHAHRLRHTAPATTAIYAKVDRDTLLLVPLGLARIEIVLAPAPLGIAADRWPSHPRHDTARRAASA
jgi:hypothetical protein